MHRSFSVLRNVIVRDPPEGRFYLMDRLKVVKVTTIVFFGVKLLL